MPKETLVHYKAQSYTDYTQITPQTPLRLATVTPPSPFPKSLLPSFEYTTYNPQNTPSTTTIIIPTPCTFPVTAAPTYGIGELAATVVLAVDDELR